MPAPLTSRKSARAAIPRYAHSMQTADLRIDAGWIVPIEPAGALRDHALIVAADRIAAILPFDDADRAFEPRERLVLRDHVLMPGLSTRTRTPR